jgi:hypothetical protein
MYLPVAVFLKAFLAISSANAVTRITSSTRLDIFILDQEGRVMFLL